MSVDEKILPYLNENTTAELGIDSFDSASIEKLAGGDYNFNYHVSQDGRELLVRVNIEPQSGSDDQIEYEYGTLEFLAPHGVTPKPLFLDNSREHLPYGLLVEEFLAGKHLEFSVAALQRVALAMATLHAVPIEGAPLQVREDPLKDQFDAIVADLESYRQRTAPEQAVLDVAGKILDTVREDLPTLAVQYKPRSVVHTDPNPANVIDNGEKVYLIDWEQGRIDDPSYDVGALFTPQLNKWAAPRELTDEEKRAFLDVYVEHTGDDTIEERSKLRTTLHAVNCALWAAHRIADVDEGKIDPNLGKQNYERYQAMADPDELERVASL